MHREQHHTGAVFHQHYESQVSVFYAILTVMGCLTHHNHFLDSLLHFYQLES